MYMNDYSSNRDRFGLTGEEDEIRNSVRPGVRPSGSTTTRIPDGSPHPPRPDGRHMRKPVERLYYPNSSSLPSLPPTTDSIPYLTSFLPSSSSSPLPTPASGYLTKYITQSQNKVKVPLLSLTYTPDARRIITGANSGELTVWNGLTFNFETIVQGHDDAVRALRFSHNSTYTNTLLVSGDDAGILKFWQMNMNNLRAVKAHKAPIRDISFSPPNSTVSSCKLASASDDHTISIWDLETMKEERTLLGHGWDVKCVDWHPTHSILSSGSKDNYIKHWDPRTSIELATVHGHKNTVNRLRWNLNGIYYITGSRDQQCKVWDIRMMNKEYMTMAACKREITALSWHPILEHLFVCGTYDGDIHFYLTYSSQPQADIVNAHDHIVNSVEFHPLGLVLLSVSGDALTRVWSRNRPGDEMKDKYNVTSLPENERVEAMKELLQVQKLGPGTTRYGGGLRGVGEMMSMGVNIGPTEDNDVVIPLMGNNNYYNNNITGPTNTSSHGNINNPPPNAPTAASISSSSSSYPTLVVNNNTAPIFNNYSNLDNTNKRDLNSNSNPSLSSSSMELQSSSSSSSSTSGNRRRPPPPPLSRERDRDRDRDRGDDRLRDRPDRERERDRERDRDRDYLTDRYGPPPPTTSTHQFNERERGRNTGGSDRGSGRERDGDRNRDREGGDYRR